MTERETEFDFDFFEEPETEEAPARARPIRGPRRPTVGPPPGGFTPLLRLVGLIAFAIAVVVVLVLAVQSCRGDDEAGTYGSYMDDVRPVARGSATVGRQLSALLTTPTIRLEGIRDQMDTLVQQQTQQLARARELVAPGHLREQHRQMTDSLELRLGGLERLREAFRTNTPSRRPVFVGRELAADMRRFVASDILWEDGFRRGSVEILRAQGVTGVEVPRSRFLRDPELATAPTLAQTWRRIRGTTTGQRGPGPHGNALVGVKVLPGGEDLSTDGENVVIASADLAFQVTVENSGNSQGVQVKVRLRVEQDEKPVDEEQVIDVINPGQQKTVTFRNISQIVEVETAVPVHVEVVPVPDEENTDNNSATYSVLFRLT